MQQARIEEKVHNHGRRGETYTHHMRIMRMDRHPGYGTQHLLLLRKGQLECHQQ